MVEHCERSLGRIRPFYDFDTKLFGCLPAAVQGMIQPGERRASSDPRGEQAKREVDRVKEEANKRKETKTGERGRKERCHPGR